MRRWETDARWYEAGVVHDCSAIGRSFGAGAASTHGYMASRSTWCRGLTLPINVLKPLIKNDAGGGRRMFGSPVRPTTGRFRR